MKDVVAVPILNFDCLSNNPVPFTNGFSFMYSSFSGSDPKLKEFKESMMILMIRISADVKKAPVLKNGNTRFSSNKEILIGN